MSVRCNNCKNKLRDNKCLYNGIIFMGELVAIRISRLKKECIENCEYYNSINKIPYADVT